MRPSMPSNPSGFSTRTAFIGVSCSCHVDVVAHRYDTSRASNVTVEELDELGERPPRRSAKSPICGEDGPPGSVQSCGEQLATDTEKEPVASADIESTFEPSHRFRVDD